MSFSPEAIWGFFLMLLLAGIAWGAIAYFTRDRGKDGLTERETRKVMDDPGPEPMKGDESSPETTADLSSCS
jgi:hypothetical protein